MRGGTQLFFVCGVGIGVAWEQRYVRRELSGLARWVRCGRESLGEPGGRQKERQEIEAACGSG